MSKIQEDLKQALFLIKPIKTIVELEYFYKSFFKSIYPFTTENLNAYYKHFNFKNKKYLTVIGSGDQTLNAIVEGCKEIDCFDINPLAKYYQELKIQAIKDLDYYEFLMFFIYRITAHNYNKEVFNKILFNKINLTENTKIFWQTLYDSKNNIRKSQLFSTDTYPIKTLLKINKYLNEDNYYILKNILLNENITINYYDLNIKELNELNNSYDIVNLSNIADYLNGIFSKKLLINFKKTIETIKLNKDGIIILNYFYETNNNALYDDNIYSKSKVENIFGTNKIKYIEFEPITEEKNIILKKLYKNKDYILCYRNNVNDN